MIESAEVRLPLTPPSASNLDLLKEIASKIRLPEGACR
jgi:hypothetical protein